MQLPKFLRMAIILVPAIARFAYNRSCSYSTASCVSSHFRRGDIENLGLYMPFAFGMILKNLQSYNSKIIKRFKNSGSDDDGEEEDDQEAH